MRIGLLAEKIGMTRFYDKEMVNHSVTILKVQNCKIISKKNKEKHGYNSITLSYGITKKNPNKAFQGFLKKNNLKVYIKSQEFRVDESETFQIGKDINANNFMVGQFVDVSSNSIGKGFAGGMKRHNFAGNRATHGVSISHRSHGSTGQCQDPGKVFKGKKMAGRLGNKKVTVQNLKVLNIDLENNLLVLKGAVPGHKGSLIRVIDSVKKNQEIKISDSEEGKNTQENMSTQNTKDLPLTQSETNHNPKSEEKKDIAEKNNNETEAIQKANDIQAKDEKPTQSVRSEENEKKNEQQLNKDDN